MTGEKTKAPLDFFSWHLYFDNGTHTHNTIHIALGKNAARKGVVHSNLHMDMDIIRPTVSLDGLVIIRDGKFVDSVLSR